MLVKQGSLIQKVFDFYSRAINHPGKWWVVAQFLKICNPVAPGTYQVRRQGLHWQLDPSDFVHTDLFWFGSKDIWDLFHIMNNLKDGGTMFDIGANFGYYACMVGASLNQSCSVYAFEPVPSTYIKLCKHIQMNKLRDRVHPIAAGLSNSESTGTLNVPAGNSGASYFTSDVGEIPLTTLDHFCEQHQVGSIDVMKIDVEGFELNVLQGGSTMLAKSHPVILIEINPRTLRRQGKTPGDVLVFLRQLGYTCYFIKRKKLIPFTAFPDGDDFVNILCRYERNQ